MKFSIKDSFSKCDQNPQFPAELVTFTEEILNGKLHFLCSPNFQQIKVTIILISHINIFPLFIFLQIFFKSSNSIHFFIHSLKLLSIYFLFNFKPGIKLSTLCHIFRFANKLVQILHVKIY